MKKIIIIILILVVGWYGSYKYGHQHEVQSSVPLEHKMDFRPSLPTEPTNNSRFKCDGRTHCSQMTSCAEATFFIRNCPNTKMDGDNDGIPCERQWCNSVPLEHKMDFRPSLPTEPTNNSRFKCDGRTHCSQMTSCAEATFFIRNCPNTKMDGDNDGIPCERQWCN